MQNVSLLFHTLRAEVRFSFMEIPTADMVWSGLTCRYPESSFRYTCGLIP